MMVIVCAGLFTAPRPHDRALIIPGKLSVMKHDYQVFPRKDTRDVTARLKTEGKGGVGKFVTGAVELFFQGKLFM
jgi:hypothetical protein